MKNKSFWIFVLLSLIGVNLAEAQVKATGTKVFYSSNPKAPDQKLLTDAEVLEMNFDHLFALNKTSIVREIKKSAGGKVRLEVFLYDASKPDGLGAMIYGIEKINNGEISIWVLPVTLPAFGGHQTRLKSDETAELLSLNDSFIWRLAGSLGISKTRPNEKVVIKATVEGELDSFTIPGMGTFQAEEVFKPARFAEVNGKVSIASHRGFWLSHAAPENTYAAFKAALDAKFDLIEMDLWETYEGKDNEDKDKEGKLIVFHDVGLSKRTDMTGPVKHYNNNLKQDEGIELEKIYKHPIKNRFEEIIDHEDTRLRTLQETLDKLIEYGLKDKEVFLNLDRSANDMAFFKKVYQVFKEKRLLNKAIFKGKWFPVADKSPVLVSKQPTVQNLRNAFKEMYPNASPTEIDNHIKLIYFTPIFIDNSYKPVNQVTNDNAYALVVKEQIDNFINAGFADGFELNFKAYPSSNPNPSGDFTYTNSEHDKDIYLLKKHPALGVGKTFVDYVKEKKFPVGMFASVPEVCAVPDYIKINGVHNGKRDPKNLVSGLVKEDYSGTFPAKINDQGEYDYRGNWDFYIGAGADYVINDRPDALLRFLKAVGKHN